MTKKILICEDDIITLRAVETKLKREGYETITAMDGKIAEEIIRRSDFDLLITDLLMPYTTGLELIHLVKQELKLDRPIFIITSIGLEDTVLKAFRLGADDYVIKPLRLNELVFRIKLIFQRIDKTKIKEKKTKVKKQSGMKTKQKT
jgi:DNA-binding response OmpR family regulator